MPGGRPEDLAPTTEWGFLCTGLRGKQSKVDRELRLTQDKSANQCKR